MGSDLDSFDQALGIGPAFARNVKAGAVIYRGADNGKTDRNVDRAVKGQKL